METSSHDKQQASTKMCAWLHIPPFTEVIYNTDFPPNSLEQFLRVLWNSVSQPIVLILPPSRKIYAFELWCWRRLLRVPWTARRSNQSILKELSPGCSLEGLMLKLKLQYFGHLMWGADSLEKTLMLGAIGSRRRRGQQRMRWLDGIIDWMGMSVSQLRDWDGQGGLACCDSWGREELDTTERLNWTELKT